MICLIRIYRFSSKRAACVDYTYRLYRSYFLQGYVDLETVNREIAKVY
jgi:hypothetical protein